MKKLLSVLLATALLATMLAVMAVPASASSGNFVGTFDTSNPDGTDPHLFVGEDLGAPWWYHVSFKPVNDNKYEIVTIADPNGTQTGVEALEMPEGGFVWCVYAWPNAETQAATAAAVEIIKNVKVGDIVTIKGLDLANKTVAADATISYPGPTMELEVENNIALGKSYTRSKTYKQGGKEVDWAYDENAVDAYPDTNNVELTDGIIANNDAYTNEAWVGLHDGTPDAKDAGYSWVTVDLGEVSKITSIQVYIPTAWVGKAAGVNVGDPAATVVLYGSNDGETFTEIGTATTPDINVENNANAIAIYDGEIEARYVEVRMVRGGWTFISEVVIIGADEPDVPSEEPSDEPSVEPDVPSEEPSEEPDAPSEEPDAPSEEPDAPSEEPDAPSEEPEAPSEEPDAPSEEPDAPSEAPSKPSTSSKPSTPATGDSSSMLMFAVIALVAIAGSAVVIKNRK